MSRPAWQTEELEEEWIEDDDEESLNVTRSGGSATSSISLTEAIGSLDITEQNRRSRSVSSNDGSGTGPALVGTFVVREDVEAVPLMPKTPGKPKTGLAGMFTPLALEKMFEPPSPPPVPSAPLEPERSRSTSPPQSTGPRRSAGPSPLSQSHLPVPIIPIVHITPSTSFQLNASTNTIPPSHSEDGDTRTSQIPSAAFTFTAPRFTPSPVSADHGPGALAESTPGPSRPAQRQHLDIATPNPAPSTGRRDPPSTDPRLRLFQFQYDTFTRDHLSAILDNMPVNAGSPSTSNFSPSTGPALSAGPSGISGLSHVGEITADSVSSIDRMRAAKRVKLSMRGESDESSGEDQSPPVSARSRTTADSYGEGAGAGAHIGRPMQAQLLQVQSRSADNSSRRDYVKESMAFMQQLKSHRDFSTVSTTSAMGDSHISPIVSKGPLPRWS
jgi:hypothetical protein